MKKNANVCSALVVAVALSVLLTSCNAMELELQELVGQSLKIVGIALVVIAVVGSIIRKKKKKKKKEEEK